MCSTTSKMREAKRTVTPRQVEIARLLRKKATPAEAMLWEALRNHRLDGLKFRRQHEIAGFIVDFFCPQKRLVIEVDGPIHEAQRDADAAREAILRSTGHRVLHVTNDAVLGDINSVLTTIRTAAFSPLHPSGGRRERGRG